MDAIQAERRALVGTLLAPVAGQLAVLDEIERLAVQLHTGDTLEVPDTPAVAAAPAKKGGPSRVLSPRPPATGRGRDGLSAAAGAALQKVRDANGKQLARVEIGASNEVMQTLVKRGLVQAHGQNQGRRYSAATNGTPARSLTTFGQGREPKPAGPSLQGRLIEAVGYKPGSVDELARRLNTASGVIVEACDALVAEGEIVLQDDGRYRST